MLNSSRFSIDIYLTQVDKINHLQIKCCRVVLVAMWLSAVLMASVGDRAWADDSKKAQTLVDKATGTLNAFARDPQMTWFRNHIDDARALMILPTVVKGGFIFGASGGNGVLLGKDSTNGRWSPPAFYTIGSVTFGLQIGGEVSEIVLMVMTDNGMDALLNTDFRLGGDVSVAVGPIGVGAKGQIADIVAFSHARGAYGGINIEGSVIKVRNDLNAAYYAHGVRPRDILVRRSVGNTGADTLRRTLAEFTSGMEEGSGQQTAGR